MDLPLASEKLDYEAIPCLSLANFDDRRLTDFCTEMFANGERVLENKSDQWDSSDSWHVALGPSLTAPEGQPRRYACMSRLVCQGDSKEVFRQVGL